jgi:hypothetical protein
MDGKLVSQYSTLKRLYAQKLQLIVYSPASTYSLGASSTLSSNFWQMHQRRGGGGGGGGEKKKKKNKKN